MTTATSKLTALRRTLALAGAFAAVSVAPMTFAAQTDAVPSITVRYSDLNLATASGVDALYHRISKAASNVCPNPDIRDLTAASLAKQCQVEAIARAVRDVNNPKLAVMHASHVSRG